MEHVIPDIFREIFHLHYPMVRRRLVALVRDESAAEDLAQEVFLRLYRNPPDEPGAIGAWLHRVLTRVGYDYLRRLASERTMIQKQEQLASSQEQSSNETLVLDKFKQQEMQELLNTLPERDRRILMLRYSGYSYAEIAELLKVKPPNVGTLLHRALARLKRQAGTAPTFIE